MAGARALALRGETTGVELGQPGTGKALETLHHPSPLYEFFEDVELGFSWYCKGAR